MQTLFHDLRYGIRTLAKNPAFTGVAILTLAFGIGANSAIFQLVNAVRLRTLPVSNPQELVTIDFARGSARSGWFSTRSARMTSTIWDQVQSHAEPFAGTIAWSASRFNLAQGGEAHALHTKLDAGVRAKHGDKVSFGVRYDALAGSPPQAMHHDRRRLFDVGVEARGVTGSEA